MKVKLTYGVKKKECVNIFDDYNDVSMVFDLLNKFQIILNQTSYLVFLHSYINTIYY